MLIVLEKMPDYPVNLGSGRGVSIREIVEIILSHVEIKTEVIWDKSKPTGDKKRLMDITRAKKLGFQPMISLEEGIKEVVEWYRENRSRIDKRYNVFKEENSV